LRTASAFHADGNKPDLIFELQNRGLVDACSGIGALREAAKAGSIRLYCGFDPTADSLHLGNLLAIIVMTWFRKFGHNPVALIGGATGRVGDPSGKQTERPLLTETQLQTNSKGESLYPPPFQSKSLSRNRDDSARDL